MSVYATSISDLIPLVGGEQFVKTLLIPLEQICIYEDIVIRTAVCNSPLICP